MEKQLKIKVELDRSAVGAQAAEVADQLKGLNRSVAADSKKASASEAEAARQASKSRLDAASKASAGIRDAVAREKDAFDASARAGALSYAKMGLSAGLAQQGVQKLIDLAGTLGRSLDAAGEKSRRLTEGFVGERDRNRELAALMGRKNDNAFTLDQARFNAATGSTPEEGRAFNTALYNAGGQYKGATISDKEFDQFAAQTAEYALAKGYSPTETGDVAGTVLGFTDFRKFGDKASEVALGKTNSAAAILQRGKGDFSTLARQFSMATSAALSEDALKGVFQDSDEVAAVISAAAEKHDAQAAELTQMAGRGLRDFTNPMIKKAGVTPADSFIAAFGKIGGLVDAEVKARQAKTPGFKVEDYLRENLKDEGTIGAFNVFLNKGVTGGAFADRMALAKANAGTAPALDLIAARRGDEDVLARRADARIKLAEAERGAENSRLDVVRKQAIERLIRRRELDSTSENVRNALINQNPINFLGKAEQFQVDAEAQRILNERTPAGTVKAKLSDLGLTPLGREDFMRKRIGQIEAAGGNPLRDLRDVPAPDAGPGRAAAAGAGPDAAETNRLLQAQLDEARRQNALLEGRLPPAGRPKPIPKPPPVQHR